MADNIEEEFEIVEHEQAHAVAVTKGVGDRSLLEEEEEEGVWSYPAGPQGNLSEPFLDNFSSMINSKNLKSILKEQDSMLSTLEVSNEKLSSLNDISGANFQAFSQEFKQQTQSILVMKRQLDSCFRRIRSLKSKLASQHPQAYAVAVSQYQMQLDEEDDDR